MKKWIFFFTIAAFLTAFILLSQNSNELKAFDFTSSESYGVATDGTFFIHQDVTAGLENIRLVVLDKKIAQSDSTAYESSKKAYKMIKVGDYFVYKPKTFNKTFYYFKSGIICLPTFNKEMFKKEDLVKNQCEGYLLKMY